MIFAVSAQPNLPQAPLALLDLLLKKGAHMTEYAILALLIRQALGPADAAGQLPRLALSWTLAVLYAATDELHQGFVAGRTATPVDVGIDAVGALVGLLTLLAAHRIRGAVDRSTARTAQRDH